MATWYSLPLEIQTIVLEHILANRTISKICPLLSCLTCYASDRQSDFLSLRLVSKEFISTSEANRVLFKSAKLAVHHAAHLKSVTTSDFPCQRLRHIELPENCVPVHSKVAFSLKDLKKAFPDLQSINIRTSYPLHYRMCADEPIYAHAYGALRISKARKGYFGLAQFTAWPEPSRDELCAARNQPTLIFKPDDKHTNPHVNPYSNANNLSLVAGQNILAASLDHYAVAGPYAGVNPYLTAWHARLIHDAYLDPSKSVKVIVHAPLELRVCLLVYGRGVVHTVRHTTVDSTDMILRFALNATEIQIPQVLNQSWFDSRFRIASVKMRDRAIQMQPFVKKQRSGSF